MAKTNKNFIFLIVILVVGFIAGILLAAPLGISPRTTIQEQTVAAEVSTDNPQVHDLLSQISEAFEEAAATVS